MNEKELFLERLNVRLDDLYDELYYILDDVECLQRDIQRKIKENKKKKIKKQIKKLKENKRARLSLVKKFVKEDNSDIFEDFGLKKGSDL
jgi:ElaB/YqjD/DUF883 family membrane-anchored ribosome-binding protein